MLNTMKAEISSMRQITSIFFIIIWNFSGGYVVYFQYSKITPYCRSADVTNEMHMTNHIEIDVKDFVLGEAKVIVLKMFIKHRNKVISKVIRPGIISWGIAKLICKSVKKFENLKSKSKSLANSKVFIAYP